MTHQAFGCNELGNQFFDKLLDHYLDETGQTAMPRIKE